MQQQTVYLKLNRSVAVYTEDVFLSDLGEIQCRDEVLCSKLRAIKVHHFSPGKQERTVISGVTLIEMMENLSPSVTVQLLGETDVCVQKVQAEKYKGPWVCLKILFVCLISFFGTAFTIMAYHNDVGIHNVFLAVYKILMGRDAVGVNPLEVSYSIGLAVGIVLFFNHVGRRKITSDPTPIEVSIRNYEEDVDKTLIEAAEREGSSSK